MVGDQRRLARVVDVGLRKKANTHTGWKLKSILVEWEKTDDKKAVIKMMQSILFKQRETQSVAKKQKKIDNKYIETKEPVKEGDKVKMVANRQVGIVIKMRGKKAIVQVGAILLMLLN